MTLHQRLRSGNCVRGTINTGGKSHETINDTITELQARNRPDLLTLGYNFAGLVLTDEIDQQWLKERFSKVQDIFEGSWVFQEMTAKSLEKGIEKGREEGRQLALQALQTMQQAAIGIVAARFPELEELARTTISAINDLNRLQMLIIELSTSSSQEHTKRLLLLLAPSA
jgi:predicted transposase YdaD